MGRPQVLAWRRDMWCIPRVDAPFSSPDVNGPFCFVDWSPFVMREPLSTQRDYLGAAPKETSMSERYGEDEQAVFLASCSISSSGGAKLPKIGNEIRWRLQLASRQDQPDHEPAAQDVEPSCSDLEAT
jgi:hypothetical protein